MKSHVFGALAILLAAPLVPVQAAPTHPGYYSEAKFEVHATRGHKAAMRDGVKLSVDAFQSKAEGKFPAILIITPYSNNPGFAKRGTWFAQRGYVVAMADSRGRFDSEGTWDSFDPKHKTDGYDLVEWLAHQPWCGGRFGMMCLSYMGLAQWSKASQEPPSLKCIVPEVAQPDAMLTTPYQSGVLAIVILIGTGRSIPPSSAPSSRMRCLNTRSTSGARPRTSSPKVTASASRSAAVSFCITYAILTPARTISASKRRALSRNRRSTTTRSNPRMWCCQ